MQQDQKSEIGTQSHGGVGLKTHIVNRLLHQPQSAIGSWLAYSKYYLWKTMVQCAKFHYGRKIGSSEFYWLTNYVSSFQNCTTDMVLVSLYGT